VVKITSPSRQGMALIARAQPSVALATKAILRT